MKATTVHTPSDTNTTFNLLERIRKGRFGQNSPLRSRLSKNKQVINISCTADTSTLSDGQQTYHIQSLHFSVNARLGQNSTKEPTVFTAHLSVTGAHIQRTTVLAFFDCRGKLIEGKDPSGKVLPLAQELLRSQMHTIQFEGYKVRLELHKQTLERLRERSQIINKYFTKSVKTPEYFATHHKERQEYMSAVKHYIRIQTEFNDVALLPSNIVESMQRCLDQLQAQELAFSQSKQKSQPQPVVFQSRSDKLQVKLKEFAALPNTNTVTNLLASHRILNQCFELATGVDAIDVLLKQQDIEHRAAFLMGVVANRDDLDSVKQLKKIVRDVPEKAVNCAALGGAIKTLEYLLPRYRGQCILVHQFMPLEICLDLPTSSLAVLYQSGYASIKMIFASGNTQLHAAVELGDIDRVTLLLQHGADVNAQRSQEGMQISVRPTDSRTKIDKRKQTKLAETIANVDNCSDYTTPMMLACRMHRLDIVKALVAHGAKPGARQINNHTVGMYVFCQHEQEDYKDLAPDSDLMRYFIDTFNYDINEFTGPTEYAQTFLHFAVQYNRPDYAALLLNFNADPNIVRNGPFQQQRFTALQSACIRGYVDLVALIVRNTRVPLSLDNINQAKAMYMNSDHFIELETLLNEAIEIHHPEVAESNALSKVLN